MFERSKRWDIRQKNTYARPDAIILPWPTLEPSILVLPSFADLSAGASHQPCAARSSVYVWDAYGKRYLDMAGSAAVNFIGYGVPEIPAAMAEQAAKLEFVHTSQFTTPVAEEYAEELLAFAGGHFHGGAVYFTCGGSESIETALKLARQYQVEIGQTSRYPDHQPPAELSPDRRSAPYPVSGNKRRREIYLPMVREFPHIGMPYCYRCDFDRLHRRMPQLRPAICRRTPNALSKHRTTRLQLSSSSRSAAPRPALWFLPAGVSAVCRGHLPPPRPAPDRRRSHDRHGTHRPQFRR